jgi:aminoglycoside 2'-N-acetyltransferase I
MHEVRVAHTTDVGADDLGRARALLGAAFDGGFADDDWEHALGGMHALAWEGGELVGHASLVQRRILHGGRALRAGYVEAVYVLQLGVTLDLADKLTCDWRDGDAW